jgi:hypothetical protein
MSGIPRRLWRLLSTGLAAGARILDGWATWADRQTPVAHAPDDLDPIPAHWRDRVGDKLGDGQPPAHWLAYVAARAPHLLAEGGMLSASVAQIPPPNRFLPEADGSAAALPPNSGLAPSVAQPLPPPRISQTAMLPERARRAPLPLRPTPIDAPIARTEPMTGSAPAPTPAPTPVAYFDPYTEPRIAWPTSPAPPVPPPPAYAALPHPVAPSTPVSKPHPAKPHPAKLPPEKLAPTLGATAMPPAPDRVAPRLRATPAPDLPPVAMPRPAAPPGVHHRPALPAPHLPTTAQVNLPRTVLPTTPATLATPATPITTARETHAAHEAHDLPPRLPDRAEKWPAFAPLHRAAPSAAWSPPDAPHAVQGLAAPIPTAPRSPVDPWPALPPGPADFFNSDPDRDPADYPHADRVYVARADGRAAQARLRLDQEQKGQLWSE